MVGVGPHHAEPGWYYGFDPKERLDGKARLDKEGRFAIDVSRFPWVNDPLDLAVLVTDHEPYFQALPAANGTNRFIVKLKRKEWKSIDMEIVDSAGPMRGTEFQIVVGGEEWRSDRTDDKGRCKFPMPAGLDGTGYRVSLTGYRPVWGFLVIEDTDPGGGFVSVFVIPFEESFVVLTDIPRPACNSASR